MTTGLESVASVQLKTVEPSGPPGELVDVNALGREFEQGVFGEAPPADDSLVAGAGQDQAAASDSISQRLVETMQGLDSELQSTMDEVIELVSKRTNQAELLQVQLKAVQLFITHELSSKIVSKASGALDQLVHSQ